MEIDRQQNIDNLIGTLRSWNRQEQQFAQLFGAGALQDKEFLRMKLGQYDRMYYTYGKQASTTDERAMMLMLRFQRKKIRKSLYPGLLRRTIHRAAARIGAVIRATRLWQQPLSMPSGENYNTFSIEPAKKTNEGSVRQMPHVRPAQFRKLRRNPSKGKTL